MKNTFYILAFSSFFITACTFQHIENGLNLLQGENIKTAISYLGYPDAQQEIAGDTVYTWNTAYTATTITPVTNYTSGTANASGTAGYAYGAYRGTTTSYVPQTHSYQCTIKIITDKKNIIKHSQYQGDMDGCSNYGLALSKLIEDREPEE